MYVNIQMNMTNARAKRIVVIVGRSQRMSASREYRCTPTSEARGVHWRKSDHSNPNGSCVELTRLPGGAIIIRDSRDPGGPALVFTAGEIAAFIRGVKEAPSTISVTPLRHTSHRDHSQTNPVKFEAR
jgi:hypothetical protein